MEYANIKTKGMITALLMIVGRGTSKGCFLKTYPMVTPNKVARLPKITSQIMAPVKKFEIKQPANNPGIAAGVNIGNIQRHSENLI